MLEKRDNSDITFLLDGYDEFSHKSDDSLVLNIIKRKILPQCRIVITSRPIASEKLQKLADVRVEVLGFTEESRRQYIKKELKDYPTKVDSLLSYLKSNEDIDKACYIPIIMTVMVCIFKHYVELPTNQSEIYERFIIFVILRYLKIPDTTLPKSISSLPENYQKYLQQLSKFAFETMESEKVIFSNEDIEKFSDSFSKKLHGLGLFRATEQFSLINMGNCVWYNFLHLSIHEFLAAFYVKSLELSEQCEKLEQTFFNQRYLNVWMMFVGLLQVRTHNSHQFVTYSHIYGTSDAAKDDTELILQNLYLLQFSKIQSIILEEICCKNNEDNLQTDHDMIQTITVDSTFLLKVYSRNLFVSLCSVTNSDQLIEI